MRAPLLIACVASLLAGCPAAPSGADGGRASDASTPPADAAPDTGPIPECLVDLDCDDGDGCTEDMCLSGGCGYFEDPDCFRCAEDAECVSRVTPGPCGLVGCDEGACVRRPNPAREGGPCDDADLCTQFDRCVDGICAGDPVECSTEDPCLEAGVCDPASGACTTGAPRPEGSPCNADDDGCTNGDACRAGVCRPGDAVVCDDGIACTTDACVSTGPGAHRCEGSLAPGQCAIEAMCWSEGERRPGNDCQLCDPATDPRAWSGNVGLSCNDADGCTDSDACSAAGVCMGTPRRDAFESNDVRGSAHSLGRISDRDGWPRGSFAASLFPDPDEDWFRYHVSDDVGGIVEPRVELSGLPAASDYDLCVYWDCDSSNTGVSCPGSSTPHSFDGLDGCCSARGASVTDDVRMSPTCSGADDSGTVYVRVYRFSGPWTCESYTLRWGDT